MGVIGHICPEEVDRVAKSDNFSRVSTEDLRVTHV